MDKFQSGSIVLLLVFYGIYFGKMLGQKKKGIRTNQIAKGEKAEELMYIEFIMKIATIGVPVYELVSILWGINKASENMRIAGLIIATVGVMIFGLSVYTMRDSWRAGIPESDRTKMVSEGIYSIIFRQGERRKQQQQRMMRLEGKNAAEGGETGNLDIHGDLTEHRPAAGQADMRVFYGFDALPHFVRPTVTVGSYDGVHSGHLALLRTVARRARAQGGESVVLTFEPHPRVTLGRADGLRLLTSLEEKIYLLGQQGIDNLIVIPFDKAFSALAPDTFIRDYLVGRIGAETLVVGFNHRFGRDKQGSYDYLGSHGFGLEVVEVGECDVDAEKVSSTVIRHLVAQGDMARAARLLSHPYLVIGTAAAGRIRTDDPLKLLPPAGSYQVRIGGRPARLTVDASQNLIIRDGCPDGRAVLTF